MGKRLWWVTRPTRDLHDIEDSLKSFASIAKGKKWAGNRKLHQKFEMENPAKTPNVGKYGSRGSGGRTWAAWLRMWGMWYNDQKVTLTDAGKMIADARKPEDVRNQIVHMIMSFQITSSYHERLSSLQVSDFQIFPFRFMLKLLLDKRIKFLSVDEVGLFLLDVKNHGRYGTIADKILDWRKSTQDGESRKRLMSDLVERHMKKHHSPRTDSPLAPEKYWRSVRDIASTFVLNISYINELRYDNRTGTVSMREKGRAEAEILLAKYENFQFSALYKDSETAFMRRFGTRYDRRKASSKDTAPMTSAKKRGKRILDAVQRLRTDGDASAGSELIDRIQEITNYPREDIEKAVSEGVLDQLREDAKYFEEYYMECAAKGSMHREFEKTTRKIFTALGFDTEKRTIPRESGASREIDGLILNKEAGLSGLLECKSGAKYAFPVGDCEKMKHVYIKNFKTKKIRERKYALDFFVYVVGGSVSGLGNFSDIAQDTGLRGSVILARDLLKIYSMHRSGRITPVRIWSMLKSNKLITETDIDDALS